MKEKEMQDVAFFVSFCIEQYAGKKQMSRADVSSLFMSYGLSDYLVEYYDVLHSESVEWILNDIDEFISVRRKEEER